MAPPLHHRRREFTQACEGRLRSGWRAAKPKGEALISQGCWRRNQAWNKFDRNWLILPCANHEDWTDENSERDYDGAGERQCRATQPPFVFTRKGA